MRHFKTTPPLLISAGLAASITTQHTAAGPITQTDNRRGVTYIDSTWLTPETGFWSDAEHWSTGAVPNNIGAPEGTKHRVTIAPEHDDEFLLIQNRNIELELFELDAPNGRFRLNQSASLSVQQGAFSSGSVTLEGTLGGAWSFDGADIVWDEATLHDVTVNEHFEISRGRFRVSGATRFAGGLSLNAPTDETGRVFMDVRADWTTVDTDILINGSDSDAVLWDSAVWTIDSESTVTLRNGSIDGRNIQSGARMINQGAIVVAPYTDGGLSVGGLIGAPFENHGAVRIAPNHSLWFRDFIGPTGDIEMTGATLLLDGDYQITQPMVIEPDETLELDGRWQNQSVINNDGGTLRLRGITGAGSIGVINQSNGGETFVSGIVNAEGGHIDLDMLPDGAEISSVRFQDGSFSATNADKLDWDYADIFFGAALDGQIELSEPGDAILVRQEATLSGTVRITEASAQIEAWTTSNLEDLRIIFNIETPAQGRGDIERTGLSIFDTSSDDIIDATIPEGSVIEGGGGLISGKSGEKPSQMLNEGLIVANQPGREIFIQTRDLEPRTTTTEPRVDGLVDRRANTPRTYGTLFNFENQGTVKATNGGTIRFETFREIENLGGGGLNGGTWIVEDGSTIDFNGPIGAMALNNADVTVTGPTASFPTLAGLLINNESLHLGDRFALGLSNFLRNTGDLTLTGAASITVPNEFEAHALSRLAIELIPGGSDTPALSIGADAALDGTLELLIPEGAPLMPGDSWALLHAEGGFIGAFEATLIPSIRGALRIELIQDEQTITAVVVPAPAGAALFITGAAPIVVRRRRRG